MNVLEIGDSLLIADFGLLNTVVMRENPHL